MIVDRNRLQQAATTRETNDLQKVTTFGFAVVEVNGHGDLLDVLPPFPTDPGSRPS